METVIRDMIEFANLHHDEEMANAVYKLVSHWRDLGEQMAEEYKGNDWVMKNCKLWDFEQKGVYLL